MRFEHVPVTAATRVEGEARQYLPVVLRPDANDVAVNGDVVLAEGLRKRLGNTAITIDRGVVPGGGVESAVGEHRRIIRYGARGRRTARKTTAKVLRKLSAVVRIKELATHFDAVFAFEPEQIVAVLLCVLIEYFRLVVRLADCNSRKRYDDRSCC